MIQRLFFNRINAETRASPIRCQDHLAVNVLANKTEAPVIRLQVAGARTQVADETTFYFRVVGDTIGTVWGTDVYTGDSSLPTAAVHAGLVQPGGTAVIKVTVVQPLGQYQGSARNGVTSRDFGQFGTAYRVSCV